MTTKTDYQQLKRLVFSLKDYSERINGAEANQMVQDACQDAFEGLDDQQRAHVDTACKLIQANVHRLGDKGTLELIAALGDFITHNEVRR
jgi:hypothetical protein